VLNSAKTVLNKTVAVLNSARPVLTKTVVVLYQTDRGSRCRVG
jgi:hypothetical protein